MNLLYYFTFAGVLEFFTMILFILLIYICFRWKHLQRKKHAKDIALYTEIIEIALKQRNLNHVILPKLHYEAYLETIELFDNSLKDDHWLILKKNLLSAFLGKPAFAYHPESIWMERAMAARIYFLDPETALKMSIKEGKMDQNSNSDSILITMLKDPSYYIRALTARIIVKIKNLDLLKLVLCEMGKTKNLQRWAFRSAILEGDLETYNQIVSLYKQSPPMDPSTRIAILDVLQYWTPTPLILDELKNDLQSSNEELRILATTALTKYPSAYDIRPFLLKMLNDSSSSVKKIAELALGKNHD